MVDLVALPLPPHGRADDPFELLVPRSRSERGPQIGLVHGEQTRPELAVGGEPETVARVAEGFRHAGDDADRAWGSIGEPVGGRGLSVRAVLSRQRIDLVD